MPCIIINPVAGGASPRDAQRRVHIAEDALRRMGQPGDVVVSERHGHARDLAAAAVSRGESLVLAWGGDGTVNQVASALVQSEAVLGIVPAGSGNGLARELRLPRREEAAIAVALTAAPRRIDAAQLGGHWFFSIAGIGFDARVAAAFAADTAGRRGFSTYARLTARELWRYRCADYEIDGVHTPRTLLVTFANASQFGNGARIAPAAVLDDGLLDMVVFEERSRLATLGGLPALFTGGVGRIPGVTIRKVSGAVVEGRGPMAFHVDGEPRQGGSHLEARVVPGALLVAAGRSQAVGDGRQGRGRRADPGA